MRFAQQQTAWLAVYGQAGVDGTYEDTDGWSTQGNLSRMHPQRQQADGTPLSATITAPATTSPRGRDRLRGLVELDNRIGYAGYVWDPFLKVYHVRHRVYNAAQGVWMQRDPIGYAGGMNLYEYCEGDPLNRVDPMGLDWLGIGGVFDSVRNSITDYAYNFVGGVQEVVRVVYENPGAAAAGAVRGLVKGAVVGAALVALGPAGVAIGAGMLIYATYDAAVNAQNNWEQMTEAQRAEAVGDFVGSTAGGLIGVKLAGRPTRAGQPSTSIRPGVVAAERALAAAADAESGTASCGTAARSGVRLFEVGKYGKLKAKELPHDGLHIDHQPSHASNIARAEAELGRALSKAEREVVRQEGTAVAVPEQWHRSHSPTYGGRNTPAQVWADAMNPLAAAIRDSEAMIKGVTSASRAAAEAAAAEIRRRGGL